MVTSPKFIFQYIDIAKIKIFMIDVGVVQLTATVTSSQAYLIASWIVLTLCKGLASLDLTDNIAKMTSDLSTVEKLGPVPPVQTDGVLLVRSWS